MSKIMKAVGIAAGACISILGLSYVFKSTNSKPKNKEIPTDSDEDVSLVDDEIEQEFDDEEKKAQQERSSQFMNVMKASHNAGNYLRNSIKALFEAYHCEQDEKVKTVKALYQSMHYLLMFVIAVTGRLPDDGKSLYELYSYVLELYGTFEGCDEFGEDLKAVEKWRDELDEDSITFDDVSLGIELVDGLYYYADMELPFQLSVNRSAV